MALIASAARRFYLDGESKTEIAKALALSRFQVARLIQQARDAGMVKIEIRSPAGLDLGLADRLRSRFNLEHCLVVDTFESQSAILAELVGRSAADLISEVVGPGDVIGLSWSRAVGHMSESLTRLPPCEVVQLTGVLPRMDAGDTTTDVVRNVARVGGGPAFLFYAPLIVQDASTASALAGQPEILRATGRIKDVTVAVVAIGSVQPPASTIVDAITPADLARLVSAGVCGEISGVFVTAQGQVVTPPLSDRMICPTAEQLRAVPEVIALAYGQDRAEAVHAALASGLIRGLVTDCALARRVLN